MRYVPALDGLRAIAVITVLLFHAKVPYLKGGFLGVDIFFVLSGFLITSVLQAEVGRTGTIQVVDFYKRRAFRLVPPLAVLLFLYLAVAPFAWPTYEHHLRDAALAAAYLSDYSKALFNAPDMLRHTWSLSIEEHFYLLWPMVILLLRKRPHALKIAFLGGLYAAATAWRFYAASEQSWMTVYPRFDTRLSGLILGGLLAVMVQNAEPGKIKARVLVALVFMGVAVLANKWRDPHSLKYGVLAVEWATAFAIFAIVQKGADQRWLSFPALTYVGRLSYGIYLFHFPIMLYLRTRFGWGPTLVIGGMATFALAAASYHTVEAWARSRRRAVQAPTVCTP